MQRNPRAAVAVVMALFCGPIYAQAIEYTPIPAGFDFPASEQTLLNALAAGDVAKLRTHAWMVFGGLTQPARPNDPKSEALWETWYRADEVFASQPGPQGARSLTRKLKAPRQFETSGAAHPQAEGNSQLAFTLFNQEMRDHTRANSLHRKATLTSLNNGWNAQTPIADRKVKDYPPAAMSLKLVWMPVRKQGLTPLPIWDEQPRVAHALPQDTRTWKRMVVVDPNRDVIPPGETRDVPGFPASRVVPLKAFYHFALSASQAAELGLDAGDFMAFVGMHYTTKEIPNWVWATFWWHDKPDAGPFAKDRPDATKVAGVWRNYLMDVSYDMDQTKESDQTPNAVFNPWLEARFDNGVNSNCMTCHRRAVWPAPPASAPAFQIFLPVTRGTLAPPDPFFSNRTQLDFLWSLIMEGD